MKTSYVSQIQKHLTPDLLKPQFQGNKNPLAGHCYVASEALYHLNGGKEAGFKSKCIRHEGTTHWWIEDSEGIIYDITASQFEAPVPYHLGRACGFLTKEPSKRAKELIRRINNGTCS